MDYKEAFCFLEYFQSIMTQPHQRLYFERSLIEVNGKALEALEKQIAKKVHRNSDGTHYCECGGIVKSYELYCYQCGQRLDWENEDAETH